MSTKKKHNSINLSLPQRDIYSGVGYEIKLARENLNKSIEEVGEETRILSKYINAIETGQFDQLPGLTYIVGFLKTYSRYLKLDENDIINKYKIETGNIPQPQDLEFPSARDKGNLPTRNIIFFGIGILFFSYVVFLFFESKEEYVVSDVNKVPERLLGVDSNSKNSQFIKKDEVLIKKNKNDGIGLEKLNYLQAENLLRPLEDITRELYLSKKIKLKNTINLTSNKKEIDTKKLSDSGIPQSPDKGKNKNIVLNAIPNSSNKEILTVKKDIKPKELISNNQISKNPQSIEMKLLGDDSNLIQRQDNSSLAVDQEIYIKATLDTWIFIINNKSKVIYNGILNKDEKVYLVKNEENIITTGNAGGIFLHINNENPFQLGEFGQILTDEVIKFE